MPLRCLLFLLASLTVSAVEPTVIPLWPEGVPDALKPGVDPTQAAEVLANDRIENVRVPTLLHYPAPAGSAHGTAVVLCPGGGYARLAIGHEGHDIAAWLNSLGISCFIVKYRLKEFGHPAPLRDVTRALRIVRARAAEFHVDPARIGVMGFSAGGHAASSAATLFADPDARTGATLDAVSARPDFAILVYPVILMQGPSIHRGSRDNLVGNPPDAALAEKMSTNLRVTPATPPLFLVHAQDDQTVPVENALALYAGARAAGVPIEMHLYEKGGHGFGRRPGHGQTSEWPQRCAEWLRSHGWIP